MSQGALQSVEQNNISLDTDKEKFPPINPLTGEKWKKSQEEPQRSDHSFKMDRDAVDVVCRQQNQIAKVQKYSMEKQDDKIVDGLIT